ncbi:MAG: Mth938-like domain-containing protein [bacterium]
MSPQERPPPKIDSYSFGRITVDGRTYTSDLILFPTRVSDGWWREEGHRLSQADLREVLEQRPDVLVVGTGANGVMDVPQETRQAVEKVGIRLVAQPTDQACELYNRLRLEDRTVAALHLTC